MNKSKTSQPKSPGEYKLFSTLAAIYVTLGVTSVALGYKVVPFYGMLISGAAFVLPFRYLMGGMLADIYPLHLAKRQMWNLLIACFLFSIISKIVINLPSPSDWNHESAYQFVLGQGLYITSIASFGLVMGISLNMFIVKKLGRFLEEKVFGMRVICSTACGELVQYAICLPLIFWGMFSPSKILILIFSDFITQLAFITILTPFFSIIRYFVKEIERNIAQDKEIVFNPFKLKKQ